MDAIKQQIDAFDSKIINAHKQVQNVIYQISEADKKIHECIRKFQSDISKMTIEGNNQYEQKLKVLMTEYQKQSEVWCDAIKFFIEGREFVNQFEKSILVVVFGNVNVGKSTIGNLIAGTIDSETNGHTSMKGNLLEYFGEVPEFFEYDFADGNQASGPRKSAYRYFKEGYVETTANIQYFTRKEGLTWTDTPGICSVTKENGDLAKKYVEFADLVVFVTTSSSPAKFDELQELEKLFCKKKKRILLLINKSDRIEKDEVDGELVKILRAKSAEDRTKQEDYAQQVFCQETGGIVTELEAISVSTYLALDAIKKRSTELFEASGYPRFLNELGDICSEQAVKLKMDAPRIRIQTIIEELISGGSLGKNKIMGICQYREQLLVLLQQNKQIKGEMNQIADESIDQIVAQAMAEIIVYVQDSSREIRNGGNVNLNIKINQIITERVKDVLQDAMQTVLEDYGNYTFVISQYDEISNTQLSSKMETIERVVYEKKIVSRDPRGLIENIQHIVLRKKFTDTKLKVRVIEESFANGDNSAEVISEITFRVRNTISFYVNSVVKDIQEGYFSKEEQMIETLIGRLNRLEEELREVAKV